MKQRKKLSFFGRQVLAYSLLLILAVGLLYFCAYQIVLDISREKAIITQEQLTAATLDQVDSYLDRIMLIATQVAHDSEIVEMMQQLSTEENNPVSNYFEINADARAKMDALLSAHNEIKDPIYRIAVFTASGDYVCTNPSISILRNGAVFVKEKNFQEFLPRAFITEGRDFILMGPSIKRMPPGFSKSNCIYMLMPIQNHERTEIYGYVQVFQSLDSLFDQLDMDQQTSTDVYLFYEVNLGGRGGQIYPLDQEYPDTSQGGYYETERQSFYRWFVVLLQDQKEFLTPYRAILVYLLLGGLALLVMLFVCVYLIARHTSRPIVELSRQVRETTLTNLPEMSVTKGATDEIQDLEHAFNRMLQRLKTSMSLEQQAYLKALQAQMKPHFLYNCLATVSSMAVELDDETIPRFCDYLTSILRYESTYENGLVTLADEVRNLRNYLDLMKMRYEDDLTYEIHVDEALLDLRLPRLVLQPLAENCFDHGFRAVAPPWHIALRVFRDSGQWVIQLRDNGSGFGEEKQRQLESQIEKMTANLRESYTDLKIGGMGLANTIVRLRLTLDEEVVYSILPNEPRGSVVTLRGMLHDESSDCGG